MNVLHARPTGESRGWPQRWLWFALVAAIFGVGLGIYIAFLSLPGPLFRPATTGQGPTAAAPGTPGTPGTPATAGQGRVTLSKEP